ncbi:beta,beta-carotene 9',10'-oxygenase [Elysia marginata]|uniref:Beta,beta-carotene 9',10'-oxygenase n=1 Tax=Elysia marginata TaxID=1093978 RepID=A0AAV4H0T7_9GAST|nr:beta,beta-carotene 9',10'-oxygenase [Elysia marginata]
MSEDLTTYNQMPEFFHLEQSDHMEKPIEVQVTGEVPNWISGSLYRNGAGLYKVGPTAWNHFFDGFAILQRWSFSEGKVTFQASILDSGVYKKCAKHRRLVGRGIGSSFPDPCETIFGRLFNRFYPSRPPPSDNTNVNLMELGDRLFALTESLAVNEINPDTLTVKEKAIISEYLAIHLGTAHPHKLKDGTAIFYGTNMNYKKAYNFIAIPPHSNPSKSPFADAKVVATAPSRWKMNISYTHSFGMTENYFVQLEQPLAINIPRAMLNRPLGIKNADVVVPYEGESLDILLISRSTGERLPITYKAPEGVVFHFVNCYEESNHVVCDVCFSLKGGSAIQRVFFDSFLEDWKAGIESKFGYTRFVLPLFVDKAEEGKNLVTLPNTTATAFLEKNSENVVCVSPEYFEKNMMADLPSINYDYNGIKHRYAYTSTNISPFQHKLAKFDMVEKTVKTFEVSENYRPGEPVFLARPGATREDDGVILATIVAANSGAQSYLVVLDATSFKELARANLPSEKKMSFTFHGIFSDKKF